MLAEHARGRELIKAMRAALDSLGAGASDAADGFISSAMAYKELLEQHIEKENGVLFVVPDRALAAEQQDELFEGFEAIERERIGVGKHEEFHALMDTLAGKYL
jgi:hemerythrin-like domain-containing protein